jgi:hypothetical protein
MSCVELMQVRMRVCCRIIQDTTRHGYQIVNNDIDVWLVDLLN